MNSINLKILLFSLSAMLLFLSFELRSVLFLLLSLMSLMIYFASVLPKYRNLSVPLTAILFSIAIIEGALVMKSVITNSDGFQIIGWENEDYIKLHTLDQNGSWVLRSVSSLRHGKTHPEYDYLISTKNCLGFYVRGDCDTKLDTYHFGDSFTFGFGVPEGKIFTNSGADKPNGINFGVPGFNPQQEFQRAIQIIKILNYQKDLVDTVPNTLWFHLFMGNDLGETLKSNPLDTIDNSIFVYAKAVVNHSYLWRELKGITWKIKLGFKNVPSDYYWVEGHLMSLSNEYWRKNKNAFFEKIKPDLEELVSLYGGKIVISLIPPKEVCISSDWDGQAEQLEEYFSKFGETISVIDTMQQTSCPEYLNWFFHLDTHFSEKGHEMYYEKVIKPNLRY